METQLFYKPEVNKKKKYGEDSVLNKRSRGEKVLYVIIFIIFALYALSLISPFLFLFINSLKGGLEYIDDLNSGVFLAAPDRWLFSNYIKAFTEMKMVDSAGNDIYMPAMFLNSIWYSLFTVTASVSASTLTAYCIAKYRFKLRGFFYGIAIFSMTIPIIGTTGASFRLMYTLNIYNSPLYALLANFGGFGFNFLILYAYFSNLSWSYAEAAFIDGASHMTVFFKIMLPQAIPPILTLCIMSTITSWNDYLNVLLYLPDFPTLSSGVYRIQQSLTRGGNYPVYFAGLIVSIIPVLILFSCFSNVIMKNFTVGGLK